MPSPHVTPCKAGAGVIISCLSPRQEAEWQARPSACGGGVSSPPAPAPPHSRYNSGSESTWRGPQARAPWDPQLGCSKASGRPWFSLIFHQWNLLFYNFLQLLFVCSFLLNNQDTERPRKQRMCVLCLPFLQQHPEPSISSQSGCWGPCGRM